ncbi:SDR family NAD(P)-dependent oxidoreductase [Flavobacterium hercynium]|uniref:Short-chain dehydrogenase/reductase n=1 Tax=Flavobacterium hercynium TaxID=387094 RepID=A0A226GV40_9FLAO|nr:SDR family NAD(P)-dependent oxidoreductase [Flavobacterium hercynium]OXA85785.1 short-chain dehydrogenase/reductase [Flavobacterium hercynium]SMP15306.1 NADP-dependent 3-hydroxy acid dehydrogenase YdfG [Flavobacterium hercynium]
MIKTNENEPKVWFITGSSRGFGRVWTEAALERGDKVAATARNVESIADFKDKYGDNVLLLPLDVTNSAQVQDAVKTAHEYFGKLDVVINNAGYSLVGMIEEAKADDIRAMYETNVLGPVAVIQAVLPILREQGFGHILGTSSNLGHYVVPLIGYYCSSKWAFEAIYESLAIEVKPFGINVTIIEPGAYATEFGSENSLKFSESSPEYEPLRNMVFDNMSKLERGNPDATAQAILKVIDAKNPPLRMFLGSNNLNEIRQTYSDRIKVWEDWEDVAVAAQG